MRQRSCTADPPLIASIKRRARAGVKVLRALARDWRRKLQGIPSVGGVAMGDLRRTRPLCADFGHSRGTPIDRIYIEQFVEDHAADIKGRVLEIGGAEYTRRFGGDNVLCSEVLDIKANNPHATIVADLTKADHLAGCQFDAIILTQTLQLIFDVNEALRTVHRLLKPGGVALITVSGVSAIGSAGGDAPHWCWSFTELSLSKLLLAHFTAPHVETRAYGNVLAAIGFLEGLAVTELTRDELLVQDIDYPVVVAARAVRATSGVTCP